MAVLDLTTELLTQIRDGLHATRAELAETRAELQAELRDTRSELSKRIERLDMRLEQTRTDLLDTIVDTRIELGDRIDRVQDEVGRLVGHVVTLADRVLRLESGGGRTPAT
jgi:chromosome segregation ATPase